MKKLRTFITAYGGSLILLVISVGVSIYLHTVQFWSPLWLPDDLWQKGLDLHLGWHPFAVRPIQSYATIFLNKISGLSLKASFYTIQFSLVLAVGLALQRFLCALTFGRLWSIVGCFLYVSSFSVMAAFFEPVHSWDDFWLYLFLLMSCTAAVQGRWRAIPLYVLAGLVAREQMILLLPALAIPLIANGDRSGPRRLAIGIGVPVVIYLIYRLIVWEPIDPVRWQLLSFNFANGLRTTDTLVSLALSYGAMWLMAGVGLVISWPRRRERQTRFLIYGGLIAIGLTILAGLFFTFARETRIFFPPFVFMIPLSIIALRALWNWIMGQRKLGVGVMLAVVTVTVLAVSQLWPVISRLEFDYRTAGDVRPAFLMFQVGLAAVFCSVGLTAAAMSLGGSMGRFRHLRHSDRTELR